MGNLPMMATYNGEPANTYSCTWFAMCTRDADVWALLMLDYVPACIRCLETVGADIPGSVRAEAAKAQQTQQHQQEGSQA